ncbi:hypothetical protein POPTR_019G021400v4 [Populus trichocarpa]|jgi:ZF-HD homeobox protein with Cys/His-rich dimerization domain|uniref:Uncharacterized protein n=2 Tax=Populus trichocarpa TaxID=3694 RepID=A0ACC0RJ46_POPTR|nr:zinc-finger homeodomain protein 2 [Populus trichocarpa]KAI9377123.1 hypothetical protein POPTR_019G021400v4 [Populus trichocarpa]PNS90010.1 hypothetical protein POPTR_019G021400v4 [Populus trichocarpa]|eukprot:XP_002325346.1 zinc-finger homeodomain protein 2 [Populus trichocarpa]
MANSDSKSKPLNEESRIIAEYRECWRNHAILTGGHAVDGCGEFTPNGDQGTKEAFICEACGCHRNFHRKQVIMRDGTILLDTHHSPPPPYELYGAPYTSVSDEESLYNGSSSEKKMKARKRPKRGTAMRNKK